MSHPDEETLVAFALGEDVEADVAGHVEECASCRTEVRGTTDVVRATRGLERLPLALEDPPDRVWTAINDELASDRRRPAAGVRRPPSYLPLPKELRPARPWWQSPQAAAAAVGGIVIGVAAALLVFLVLPESKPAVREVPDLLAAGRLVPLKGETANGSAQVYDSNGQRTVTVRLREAQVKDDEYVEAWIFEPGTSKMVSLGVIDQARQTFSVPSGLNLGVYTAIDISAEPLNGDPAHSTKSLARGELESLNGGGPEASGAAEKSRPLGRASVDGVETHASMDDAESRLAARRYLLNFPGLDDPEPAELQPAGAEAAPRPQATLASAGESTASRRSAAKSDARTTAKTDAETTAKTDAKTDAKADAKPTAEPAARPAAELSPQTSPQTSPQASPQASPGGSPTATPVPGAVKTNQGTNNQGTGVGTCRANGLGQAGAVGARRNDVLSLGGLLAVLQEVERAHRPDVAAQRQQCLRAASSRLKAQAPRQPSAVVQDRPARRTPAAAVPTPQQERKVVRPADRQVRTPAARDRAAQQQPRTPRNNGLLGRGGGQHGQQGQRPVERPRGLDLGMLLGFLGGR